MRVPLSGGAATASAYAGAALEIAGELEAGHTVAVLCEGDPLIYGSFISVWEHLPAHYECEIIPGISSLLAAPARIGCPLISGQDCLTVVPGTLPDDALERRLGGGGSIVIFKVGRHLARIRSLVAKMGLLERANYVERATLANERSMKLADLAGDEAPYFSLIVISRHGARG
jgi:precorrin-2 C(20)-methyltransferase